MNADTTEGMAATQSRFRSGVASNRNRKIRVSLAFRALGAACAGLAGGQAALFFHHPQRRAPGEKQVSGTTGAPIGGAAPNISARGGTFAHQWPRNAVELCRRHAPAAARLGRRGRLTVLATV